MATSQHHRPARLPGRLPRRLDRTRQATATLLAAAFAVLLPIAVTAAWTRRTLLSTSGYVAAVAPIGADPAVRSVVRTAITDKIDSELHHAASALPAPARFLSGPLTRGLATLAGDKIGRFMASPAFRRLWITVNTAGHSQLIRVLDGTSAVVATANGDVVLNLAPLVTGVLKEIPGRLAPLVTKAIRADHAAHGRAIPLFPAAALVRARRVFRLVSAGSLWLLILTPLTAALALRAAPRRRRTLAQLAIGGTATVLGTTIAVTLVQSGVIARGQPRWRPVLTAILHALTSGFFTLALWCVISGLILTTAALLTGPYPWARALRTAIASTAGLGSWPRFGDREEFAAENGGEARRTLRETKTLLQESDK
jgi:hypothetical protein